jgi:hypothetical protein
MVQYMDLSTMKLPAASCGVSKRNSPKPTRLRSKELRRVHLAIHPCSNLQGILAKANKNKSRDLPELESMKFYDIIII